MFKELGGMMSLMKNLPKLQASMQAMQEKVGQIVAEGNAGAGMIIVKVNGRFEMVDCVISEEAAQLNDRAMLADLIMAATNQAMAKAREEVAQVTATMSADLGFPLPPGMGL